MCERPFEAVAVAVRAVPVERGEALEEALRTSIGSSQIGLLARDGWVSIKRVARIEGVCVILSL